MIEATTQTQGHTREYLGPTLIAVIATACLPLLGILAIAARPVLAVGLAALLIAVLVRIAFHKQITSWLAARDAHSYCGMQVPCDVALDTGHCWAWLNDEVVVGADDFVQNVLGPIDQVELPQAGRHVDRGEPLFVLRHANRQVQLAAPVTGTVVGVNESLREHPEMVNAEPFERGWVVRIRGENLSEDRRHLLIGRQAWRWFRQEVDYLLRSLPSGSDALYRRIDDSAWKVIGRSLNAQHAA